MILHIVIDEKFIDMAYDIFEEVAPGKNKFILVSKRDVSFNYIKRAKVDKIPPFDFFSKSFARSLLNYDFVVLHYLDNYKKKLILDSHDSVKFLWIGWGADYYNYINKDILLSETKKLYKELNYKKRKLNIKQLVNSLLNRIYFREINNVGKVLEKINYFAPVLEEDYSLVKNSFENFKPKYISWNYGTLEKHLIKSTNLKITGNNILIGNSASFENNHVEAFNMILKLKLEDRKIIVPLSYGDKIYRKKIMEIGYKMFGEKFIPLTEFLPVEEYYKIIQNCSIVIMNHLRQQALGNIVIMMTLGTKIYLQKENPIFNFFKKENAYIYAIDDLTNDSIDTFLSQDEINHNRKILNKYWSHEAIINRTKNLIEIIKNS